MPTYTIHAITIGAFNIGETDKVLSLFSAERGLVRAVAKGARKPGSKIAGRAEVLNVNKMLVATGRSLDIITQAESIETYGMLRKDLMRLSFGLYYAELTAGFAPGLTEESEQYLEFLKTSIRLQNIGLQEASMLCLDFEMQLLEILGYKPELDSCVSCRAPLTDYNLGLFNYDMGGIVCTLCLNAARRCLSRRKEGEQYAVFEDESPFSGGPHITPMVWKRLVLAGNDQQFIDAKLVPPNILRANQAARRVIQTYIEHRAGKRMKALDLIAQ
jgi:DNA repair protein RecO (recombination protein O)